MGADLSHFSGVFHGSVETFSWLSSSFGVLAQPTNPSENTLNNKTARNDFMKSSTAA